MCPPPKSQSSPRISTIPLMSQLKGDGIPEASTIQKANHTTSPTIKSNTIKLMMSIPQ